MTYSNSISLERDTLYHLIQQTCDRPAYFWFNTQWRAPGEWGELGYVKTVCLDEAIQLGFGQSISFALRDGRIDPQTFCDYDHPDVYSLTNICLGLVDEPDRV